MKKVKQKPEVQATKPEVPPPSRGTLPLLKPLPTPPGHQPRGGGALKNTNEEEVKIIFDL